MNAPVEIIAGEVVDAAPQGRNPAPSTALAVASNPFQQMAVMAMEKGAMDQFEKLLDLQLKWDGEQARKAFVAAMASFKAEPMEILKRKRVEFTTRDGITSYNHAELSDVADAVVPAMGKHGLSHRWDVKQEAGKITVTCILTHSDGHSESVSLTAAPDDSGKKNAIQQVASTVTYLQRYTLLMATGMATKGVDDDGRGFEPDPEVIAITEQEEASLRDLVEANVKNKVKFMDWCSQRLGYPVEKLSDIRADGFEIVRDQLNHLAQERGSAK